MCQASSSFSHPLGFMKLQNTAVRPGRDGQENHVLLHFKVVMRVKYAKGSLHPLKNV